MVLELANLCLRSIRDGIENGQIVGAHLGLLPPRDPKMSLRQRVLDWVLLNGSINNSNCLVALSSADFLDGMSSLSTLKSRVDDSEYLTRLANTLRSASKCGDTIGSKITNLQVGMVPLDEQQNRCVARVIGECPNLKTLSRRTVYFGRSPYKTPYSFGQVLKDPEFQSCRKIIEGISELSIFGDYFGLNDDYLAIPFTNLRSLRICGGSIVVNGKTWLALMESVKNTLITLYVDKLRILNGFDHLLPWPLSRLQDLTIASFFGDHQFLLSVDILSQCPELSNLSISVTNDSIDEALLAVNSLPNVAVNVKLSLSDGVQGPPFLLKEPPRFRIVDLFKEKITYVRLAFVTVAWNIEYAVAFEQFIDACPRLTGFEFIASPRCGRVDLSYLFNNVCRARRLREIKLNGDIIFGNLFQNCIGLDSLHLVSNLRVCNQYLIEWAQNGGRLSEMKIDCCRNVNENGLVAVLVASGSKLRKLHLQGFAYSKDRVQQSLEQNCPLAETVELSRYDISWEVY